MILLQPTGTLAYPICLIYIYFSFMCKTITKRYTTLIPLHLPASTARVDIRWIDCLCMHRELCPWRRVTFRSVEAVGEGCLLKWNRTTDSRNTDRSIASCVLGTFSVNHSKSSKLWRLLGSYFPVLLSSDLLSGGTVRGRTRWSLWHVSNLFLPLYLDFFGHC